MNMKFKKHSWQILIAVCWLVNIVVAIRIALATGNDAQRAAYIAMCAWVATGSILITIFISKRIFKKDLYRAALCLVVPVVIFQIPQNIAFNIFGPVIDVLAPYQQPVSANSDSSKTTAIATPSEATIVAAQLNNPATAKTEGFRLCLISYSDVIQPSFRIRRNGGALHDAESLSNDVYRRNQNIQLTMFSDDSIRQIFKDPDYFEARYSKPVWIEACAMAVNGY